MTLGQVALIITGVVLTGVMYLFGPLHPSEKEKSEHAVEAAAIEDLDFNAYKAEELKKLPAAELEKYEAMQTALEGVEDKPAGLNAIASLLETNQLHALAALIRKEAASLTNIDTVWKKAGNELYSLAFNTDNQSLAQYVLSQAMACYEQAIGLNPEDNEAKISLAVAHLEGQKEPMKGVMLLREITDKDPDNITANLILGKYGIVSGQFDIAAERLQKVLSIDSLNVDACLYLAEAYEGMGDKDKAIETLEQCKAIVNNPGFSDEISKYIEKLKNS